MAKITIVGDAMVITSTKTLEDMKKISKYRPEALDLKNDEGDTLFSVRPTEGEGTIGTYGASFGSTTHDEHKFATITLQIPANTKDAEAYAEERIGVAILNLNKVESQFDAALAEINTELAEVRSNIEVM